MENIALVGRPTLQSDQDEIFAEIDRVDTSSREIYLRPDDRRNRVIGYSANARVFYHGWEYTIAQLESGDKVSMQLKRDSRGNSYTDLVRVHEGIWDRNPNLGAAARPPTATKTVDGRVAHIDFQQRSFELNDQSRTSFLFLCQAMRGSRTWIVLARFGPVTTSESKGVSQVTTDLS
jgi:hypothetical protein